MGWRRSHGKRILYTLYASCETQLGKLHTLNLIRIWADGSGFSSCIFFSRSLPSPQSLRSMNFVLFNSGCYRFMSLRVNRRIRCAWDIGPYLNVYGIYMCVCIYAPETTFQERQRRQRQRQRFSHLISFFVLHRRFHTHLSNDDSIQCKWVFRQLLL